VPTLSYYTQNREYLLHKPARASNKKLALMIMAHGGMGTAKHFEEGTKMSAIADSEGFMVAYPQGTASKAPGMEDQRTWNAGKCCGAAVALKVDDSKFFAGMIDDIAASHPLDRARVYVAGMSNGAMMALRFACERPDLVAACVVNSGTLDAGDTDRMQGIPYLHIHGKKDQNVKFLGGVGPSGVNYRPVPETIDKILAVRGTNTKDTQHVSGVERVTYACTLGAQVNTVFIDEGEHEWFVDPVSSTFEAWSFAKRFKKVA